MPFADFDEYVTALRANVCADFVLSSSAPAFAAVRFGDLSRSLVPTPAVPTASVAYDRTSDRAINGSVPNGGTGRLSILGARMNPSGAAGLMVMLVDLLNISGGLDATLTTTQTTNLPTAALTRSTSGEGVFAALMIHSTIGATATTVTCSYTNSAGTSGRTTTAMIFGGSGQTAAGTLVRLPLQAGDTGVRSVESVTLAATTGTVGNFGVCLYRPLAMMVLNDVEGAHVVDCVSSGRMVGQFAEVPDDACLTAFCMMATASQSLAGAVLLGEA